MRSRDLSTCKDRPNLRKSQFRFNSEHVISGRHFYFAHAHDPQAARETYLMKPAVYATVDHSVVVGFFIRKNNLISFDIFVTLSVV